MNDSTTFRMVSYSTKQTAVQIRAALRPAFPGITFSVRIGRGSASLSITIIWTDGPPESEVRQITSRFQSSRFDPSDDTYRPITPSAYLIGGEPVVLRYCCWDIALQRQYSGPVLSWMLTHVNADQWPIRVSTRATPKLMPAAL